MAAIEESHLYEMSITSTPVASTATPSPTAVIVPTPATPIIKELTSDGYVNVTSVTLRSFPEVRDNNNIGTVPIGTKVKIVESYEFNGKLWYKTVKGSYIFAEYISLDGARVEMVSRGGITRGEFNTILTERSGLSKEQIEYLLKDGGMASLSDTILYCERLFKLNALFIISVGKHESANGTSKLARTKDNLFGFNAYGDVDKNATDYPHKNESIYRFSELIRNNYLNKGLTTTHTIGKVYCESDDWPELIDDMTKDSLRKLRSFTKN